MKRILFKVHGRIFYNNKGQSQRIAPTISLSVYNIFTMKFKHDTMKRRFYAKKLKPPSTSIFYCLPLRNAGRCAASLGPTTIVQSGSSSSTSPAMAAA